MSPDLAMPAETESATTEETLMEDSAE